MVFRPQTASYGAPSMEGVRRGRRGASGFQDRAAGPRVARCTRDTPRVKPERLDLAGRVGTIVAGHTGHRGRTRPGSLRFAVPIANSWRFSDPIEARRIPGP